LLGLRYVIQHRKGRENVFEDALSRRLDKEESSTWREKLIEGEQRRLKALTTYQYGIRRSLTHIKIILKLHDIIVGKLINVSD